MGWREDGARSELRLQPSSAGVRCRRWRAPSSTRRRRRCGRRPMGRLQVWKPLHLWHRVVQVKGDHMKAERALSSGRIFPIHLPTWCETWYWDTRTLGGRPPRKSTTRGWKSYWMRTRVRTWTPWTTRGEPRCSLQQASALKNVDLHWHDSKGFTATRSRLCPHRCRERLVGVLEEEDNQGRSPLSFALPKIS
jgi:hypothetical protein